MVTMKIRDVKKTTVKGRTYYYDRISGKRIKSPFGSAAFVAEIERRRAEHAGMALPTQPPGTFGALVMAYKISPEFDDLAERTQSDYNKVFDYLKPLHNVAIHDFDQAYVIEIRDKAYKTKKWRFANYVLAVMSLVFNWGIPRKYTKFNTAEKVPKIKRPRDMKQQNRRWLDYEQEAVLAAFPAELGVAVAIGAFTGLREGDMVRLPLNAGDDDLIEWRQNKTSEPVYIPVHKDLKPWLTVAKKLPKRKATTMVIGARGNRFTENGFRTRFFRELKKLENAKMVGCGLSFHGLRHTVGTRLAEAGADDSTIQAILGHKTSAQAQTYRRDANRKLGAMKAISILEARKSRKRTNNDRILANNNGQFGKLVYSKK